MSWIARMDGMKRVTAAAVLLSVFSLGLGRPSKTLDIFFIDVEGGQSTLVVTPAGQSLLIDAGYGIRNGRDPDRILAATREARIDHIDYLLVTHFHPDHAGGVPNLAARIPIGTFIDYGAPLGTDRMATAVFRAYEPVRAQHPHLQPRPGDRLPLKGIDADIVSADGMILSTPFEGAGQLNPACPAAIDQEEDGTENYRSLGLRILFGAFRFIDLGDLSGHTLVDIACPRNLLGEAAVYLVAHHGNDDANSRSVLAAMKPRVAIMNNGVTKGGGPETFATLRAQPGLDVWQLHASTNPGVINSDDRFIANVDEGESGYWIKLSASRDGSFSVMNSRTGFAKAYTVD